MGNQLVLNVHVITFLLTIIEKNRNFQLPKLKEMNIF